LVLSGAFEAAFKSEGVQFDAYTGSFRTDNVAAGMVDLHGEGLPALWTLRALEREGFCVVRDGTESAIRVTVQPEGDSVRWQSRINGQEQTNTTLYEVIALLRQPDTYLVE
jgi:iron complex transport system ATP-binding protein